jgi:ADP-ribose pyrophosphatase
LASPTTLFVVLRRIASPTVQPNSLNRYNGVGIAHPTVSANLSAKPKWRISMSNAQRVLCETGRFSVVELNCTRRDGKPATCKFITHPGSVAILPLVDEHRVCLIRSRRLTVGETLIELPAGTREPGETPLATARRELTEETGYRAARFEELASFYPSPGISNERMWVYAAHGLTAGAPKLEPNEDIENFVVTWDEAMSMIERGEIRDGKTLIALLLYRRKASNDGRRP